MCGISGVIGRSRDNAQEFLVSAEQLQMHRGPDSQDYKILQVNDLNVGLGHQRLSILDLSQAGIQPMVSASNSSMITYNGEIYNYLELKEEHLDSRTRSSSDTEVILEVIEKYGIAKALRLFNGMWAFAWLDLKTSKLYLARDRVGIKPLYLYIDDENLYFASEIKAVLSGVKEKLPINFQVVGEYLCQSLQDTSNQTFFEGIQALPAGCYAEIDLSSNKIDFKIHSYWELNSDESKINIDEASKEAANIFYDSVKLRMRSDVPVGVTLSGGIDSSAIASIMKQSLAEGQELKILSAVSPGEAQDESKFIDIMSKYLNNPVEKVILGWEPDTTFELMKKSNLV